MIGFFTEFWVQSTAESQHDIDGSGRRPSMGSHRVGHDWSDLAAAAAVIAKVA